MQPRNFVHNEIIPISEYEPATSYRLSFLDIANSVRVCRNVQSVDAEISKSFDTWDPYAEDSFEELFYSENADMLEGYLQDYASKYQADTLEDLASTGEDFEFYGELVRGVRVAKDVRGVIKAALQTEDDSNQPANQRALKGILDTFMAERADDGYFLDPDDISFADVTDFLDYYQRTVIGGLIMDTDSHRLRFEEIEHTEATMITEARGAFIESLDVFYEQGIVDAEQLERARQLVAEVPIVATDPLSEIFFHPANVEEESEGYFLPASRNIYMNPAVLRFNVNHFFRDHPDDFREEVYARHFTKAVFHELLHSITNTWYSSRTVARTEYDDEPTVTDITTGYHEIFPRFLRESLVELVSTELYVTQYGVRPEDYMSYPIERSVFWGMLSKFDWKRAGITSDEAFVLFKRALFDSASDLDSVQRPVQSYIDVFKALHTAATPGIITRMDAVDSQLGEATLQRIIISPNFDPAVPLRFDGLLHQDFVDVLEAVAKSTPPEITVDMPVSIARQFRERQQKWELANRILTLYTTVKSGLRTKIATNYRLPSEKATIDMSDDDFIGSLIATMMLEETKPKLAAAVQEYKNLAKTAD